MMTRDDILKSLEIIRCRLAPDQPHERTPNPMAAATELGELIGAIKADIKTVEATRNHAQLASQL